MKTLIQALFSRPAKRFAFSRAGKIAKRNNKSLIGNESSQFAKMARLGQTLVVMSR